jgi:hypothetical protein
VSGTTEPVWSVTVPTIDPVVVCATAGSAPNRRHKPMIRARPWKVLLIAFSFSIENSSLVVKRCVDDLSRDGSNIYQKHQ